MKPSNNRAGDPHTDGSVDVCRARAARERLSSFCAAVGVGAGSVGCTLLSEDFSPELLEASPQQAALEVACEPPAACAEPASGAGDAGGAESSSGGPADAGAAPPADAGAVSREPPGSPSFMEGALSAAGVLLACGAGAELGEPERLIIAGVEGELGSPALSGDGLTLFFTAADGAERIYSAQRPSRASVVFEGVRLVLEGAGMSPSGAGVSSSGDSTPFVGAGGARLYFSSALPGSGSDKDLFVATLDPATQSSSAPQPLAGLEGPEADLLPWLTADELTIVFVSARPGGSGGADLFSARRTSLTASFGAPAPVAALNSAAGEGRAAFTADGATVYFSSDREGQSDLFAATRAANGAAFSAPFAIAGLNSPAFDGDVMLSADGREVLFASERDGDSALFRATRSCR